MKKEIRKSVIAGSWYPGRPDVLRRDIEDYFQLVPDMRIDGDILALISPHAGYMYSGQIAAHAYKLIRGEKYDAVFVVGPSHRVAFHGVSVYPQGGYETPLGVIPVDEVSAREIIFSSNVIKDIPAAHMQEHSVEIQLPFLQIALGDFSFVPLVMGDQNENTCRELARIINQVARKKKVLVVGSSDLSHFHDYREAKKLDDVAIRYLEKADAEGLLVSLRNDSTEACGGGPMAVAMLAARGLGAVKSKILKYANSGDVTGDKSSVVGYVSAVFYR
ncbi:MAG: AmmeMemoRadiSam system protein B [Smithellaceae bacterium]|jgi:AmmeMemoRadiSam system protein B|nr:AmmeMemoRadiSam system protein B [Smithellaceae bacterium]